MYDEIFVDLPIFKGLKLLNPLKANAISGFEFSFCNSF